MNKKRMTRFSGWLKFIAVGVLAASCGGCSSSPKLAADASASQPAMRPTTRPGKLPTTLPTTEVRKTLCLNGMWDFTPDGGSATQIQVPSSWRRHTSSLHDNFNYPNTWTGGTYSRTVEVPPEFLGKGVTLAFGAVRYSCQVDVNGKQVGTNDDGHLPFEIKVNAHLKGQLGKSNTIAVHVDSDATAPIGLQEPGNYCDSRGIWQDVNLNAYPDIYVENEFFVKTSFRNKRIDTDVPIKNDDIQPRTFFIRNFVTDATGAIVLHFDSGACTLAAGESKTYSFGSAWSNPRYWIPEDPYLYTIHTVVYNSDANSVIDWKKTKFGFREFYLVGSQFYLNGQKAVLRADTHHLLSEYALTREYFVALFTAFKEWGVNSYRAHVHPYDPVIYEVADSMGIMIIAETAVYGSDGDEDCDADYLDHLKRFIERDRNHPSLVLWSTSNEVKHKSNFNPETRVAYAAKLDPTRVAYAEENLHLGTYMASIHYMDFDHVGLYTTLPTPPILSTEKVHSIGEYCNYLTASFGDTGTGDCGYEVKSQDYGTGFWGHGETALGQTQALQNQPLYGAYSAFSSYWLACRSQPSFSNASHSITWPNLKSPGQKPNIINPSTHTINWVDDTLPLYNPLPWLYQYIPLYQPIRCTDLMPDWKTGFPPINNCNYYAGTTISRSFDLWYESFQPANRMKAEIVKKSDGSVLFSTDKTGTPWKNIQSGTPYTGLNVSWTAPNVTEQTPVLINRTFYSGKNKQATVSFEANIFPRFTSAHVSGLTGKKLSVYDPTGTTKAIFDHIGLTYTAVTSLESVDSTTCDVLVIGEGNTTTGLSDSFVIKGGRVLCLSQTTKPALPINIPELVPGATKDVQFLLNAAKHKIFEGIDQNGLNYWADDVNTAQNVYARPTTVENIRVLCASNNDGDNAPLLEVPAGRGTYILSQMEIVPRYATEPVAGKLLVNMLNYLGSYTPAPITKTGLIADAGTVKTYFDGLPLRYEALTASALPDDLSSYKLILIDGSSVNIAEGLSNAATVTKLNNYVNAGGKVMVCQVDSSTLASYNTIISQFPMELSTPAEKTRSVKCAVSWLRKNSPKELLRYAYLNIPNPYEMNSDPLLMGINNMDLDWTSTQLNNGVKVKNRSYPDVNELIAPYRIDWTALVKIRDNGFTMGANRSRIENDWLQNRTPILLKLNQGANNGFWVINQLLLQNDEVKGKRVGNLLLTSLGASVGTTDIYYNENNAVVAPIAVR